MGRDTRYLCKQLPTRGGAGLEVFISEEIPAGENWLETVKDKLGASNLLLLIFTDPALDWDWCLYEAGLFTDLKGDDSRKVVCLHHRDQEPPDQLRHLQTVAATPEAITKFLKRLFIDGMFGPGSGVNPNAELKWLEKVGAQLSKLLVHKETQPLLPHLVLEVSGDTQWNENEIPGAAKVLDPDGDMLDLFGLTKGTYMWSRLEAQARAAPDTGWLQVLSTDVYRRSRRQTGVMSDAVYLPPTKSDLAYRALLSRVDRLTDGRQRFHIIFVQEPTLTRAISSFSELMIRVENLIEATAREDKIKWLAYTPALGFLAQTQPEWERLQAAMIARRGQLDMICLEEGQLKEWHRKFIGRSTEREDTITTDLADRATAVSEELLGGIVKKRRLKWGQLPEYYLFSNSRRAIVVTPFGLPDLDGRVDDKEVGYVEMFGAVTHDRVIASRVRDLHENFKHL